MKIRMRLYKTHDQDLCLLHKNVGQTEFLKLCIGVLDAYASGKPFDKAITFADNVQNQKTSNASFILSLNEKKHSQAADILKNVRKNMMNSFIKCLLRTYLADSLIQLYFKTGGKPIITKAVTASASNIGLQEDIKDKADDTRVPTEVSQTLEQSSYDTSDNENSEWETIVAHNDSTQNNNTEPDKLQEESSLSDLFSSLTFE